MHVHSRGAVNKESKKSIKVNEKKKKRRKGTAIQQLIEKKSRDYQEEDMISQTIKPKSSSLTKSRHRTTIMPVFLKKLKQREQIKSNEIEGVV